MGTNTGIGIGIGIPFRNSALGGDNIYFPPELKARMIGVWDNYGKKNTDADRNIIKNKIPNAGGDLEILNAAYEGMSGCNGYPVVFGANKTWENLSSVYSYTSDVTNTTIHVTHTEHAGNGLLFSYVKKDGALANIKEIPAFRVTVKGLEGNSKLVYKYLATKDATKETSLHLSNGTHKLPKSFVPTDALLDLTTNSWIGMYISPISEEVTEFDCDITIEVLPEYEGAFVTDGVNDMIISQKTIAEMGITDEVTIVSMIHQIDLNSTYSMATTNYIENSNSGEHVRSDVYNYGKTGIYGYSASLINNTKSDIKNILGDELDYHVRSTSSLQTIFDAKFSVVERISGLTEASQVAWYWTIIANKVLTTDQINQVIAYFNLDRTLKPDILCDVKKQGITNDNHAEFGDKLIDFSGNGRDIQLNNIAWDGDSGIGKYNYPNWKVTATIANTYSTIVNYPTVNGTYSINVNGVSELMQSIGLHLEIKYTTSTGIIYNDIKQDGVYSYILPDGATDLTLRFGGIPGIVNEPCNITITQIPSHAGALCLDGVNDFGKVTGMPIYKDYTFIIEREFLNETFPNQVCLVSKSKVASEIENGGAFIVDNISVNSIINPYSFYKTTSLPGLNTFDRQIVFQSKYKYLDKNIAAGTATDSDTLWLGTFRDNDSRFFNGAIYSLMSFPYSMSEFLIERQLKKHKLGTLYPNMVEFRPVIKKDDRIKSVKYYIEYKIANIGQYYPIDAGLGIAVETVQPYMVKSLKVNGVNTIPNIDHKGFNARLDSKSPQKITMDIVVDTSIILFNPTINSNAVLEVGNEETMPELFTQLNNGEIDGIILYMQGDKAVLPNNWIDKNTKVRAIIYCLDTVSEEDIHFTVDGKTKYCYSAIEDGLAAFGIMDEDSQEEQYMTNVLTANTIDIQLDQYIRYEDIVQPYPVLLRFNDENGNEVSWGGKFRVGSTITRIGSFYKNNLLDGLYIVRNPRLNGNNLITPTHVVEKSMVFTCNTEYLLDNNEPKCILSPRLLRIPNSSYKILGHIPDISGHGNHGKINNSAYKLNSGVNGYLVDFTTLKDDGIKGIVRTDSKIYLDKSFNYNQGFWLGRTNNPSPAYKVKVSGIPKTGMLTYTGGVWLNLVNGINELPARTNTEEEHGFVIQSPNLDWSNLVIEQIGEYEGAYCLDGVNDHVTIPTVTGGGKQVLMKVNNNTINSILYDQRSSGASPNSLNSDFAIYNTDTDNNNLIAYQSRLVGKTYIDGILNTNITCEDLLGVLYNITITCDIVVPNNGVVPNIGRGGVLKDLYSKVALYDFMLFDEISTEDKIKELNEYIGIEAKVELPPYYYDAYGKTNLDEDKAIILT